MFKWRFILVELVFFCSFIALNANNISWFGKPFKDANFRVTIRDKNESGIFYKLPDKRQIEIKFDLIKGSGMPDDPIICDITVKNKLEKDWQGIIRFEISLSDSKRTRFFLPGFMYGQNRGEVESPSSSMPYPRLRSGNIDFPYSPFWMVRSDRLSHPIAIVQVDSMYYGISGTPYLYANGHSLEEWNPGKKGNFSNYNGFGCSVEHQAAIYYTLGYENAPGMYDGNKIIPNRALSDNCIKIPPEGHASLRLFLYGFKNINQVTSIGSMVRNTYYRYHQLPRKLARPEETVKNISQAIFEDAWVPSINNYSTLVSMKNGEIVQNPMASISWTGGVEIAVPMLQAALRLGDETMRQQTLLCIDNIVNNSLNTKSGLPFEAFNNGQWSINGWWINELKGSVGHSSYLTGQCIWYILKAYELEKKFKNIEHKRWLEFSWLVLDKVIKTISNGNAIPYTWSAETGQGKDYDGFSGCWCLAAISYYMKLTDNKELLTICNRVDDFYYTKFVKNMECYGTPLDTWKAVDSEGILSFIKANRILHELTGNDKYLNFLMAGLEYEFTFKFCYNVPIQIPPLSTLGWSSCGGSITSTCNPHIHPMSNNVLDDILYCYNISKDPYLKMRLKDTWLWGLQTYNTMNNEMDFGKKGWMSERFSYSEALLIEKYPDGSPSSVWFCFLPWGASSILEGLCGDLWNRRF